MNFYNRFGPNRFSRFYIYRIQTNEQTNRHPSKIYIIYEIKQNIRIYVPYSRPNCWTESAEIFEGTQRYPGGKIG